ncbi:MAG: YgjV family protein, partial [Eubacteriales bacterium]
ISIYRGIIMLIGDKCRKRGFLISVQALYLLSFILAVFVFKEAWYLAILPFIGAVGSTFVMWTRDGKKIRISQLFLLSPLWLIYDAINGSVGGVLCEIFNITSVIISFIRFRKAGYDKE